MLCHERPYFRIAFVVPLRQNRRRFMNAFILIGATATGKTAVCQAIAEQTGAAILSTDALLVYKGMDIGTAKPARDEQRRVRYLGIDLFTPAENSNAALWRNAIRRQLADAPVAQSLIVTGGTGLYLRALLEPFDAPPPDPESRARWQTVFDTRGLSALQDALRQRLAPDAFAAIPDPKNPRRLLRLLERLDAGETLDPKKSVAPAPVVIGLSMSRELLHQRIAQRVRAMIDNGLLDEVRALRETFSTWSDTARAAIGYAEIADHLDGLLSLDDAIERIIIRTRQLAKRQLTWFQNQLRPVWLDTTPAEPLADLAQRVRAAWQQHGPARLHVDP